MNPSKSPHIAILGAGLSGLTMGYRLQEKGYSVSLYEARSRVGGRVHTVCFQNSEDASFIELGGHNIANGGNSPHFLTLCKEFHLQLEDSHPSFRQGFYEDGKIYPIETLLKNYNFSSSTLLDILRSLPCVSSIADILNHLFKKDPILKRAFLYYMGAYEGIPAKDLAVPFNIRTLSSFLTMQENSPSTSLFKVIQGGNSRLPLALANALDGNIFLKKVLQKAFRLEDKIGLQFQDGTRAFCDNLILSLPCTILKDIAWDKDLIAPASLEMFSKVQYGANGKVIFPARHHSSLLPYTCLSTDHVGLYSLDPNALILYTDSIWGKDLLKKFQNQAPWVEKFLEAFLGEHSQIFSDPVCPSEDIFKVYKTPLVKSWAEDPYAQGSYSAIGTLLGEMFLQKTLYKGIPVKSLFAPLPTGVFFIGEHTSLIEECGTMEAAIESAERVSQLF